MADDMNDGRGPTRERAAAGAGAGNPTASFGFDLNSLLKRTTEATTRKISAAENLNRVSVEESRRIADSANDLAKQAQIGISKLNDLTQAGAKAKALATSDNILDRVTLIGSQILNPNLYTRQGRAAQRSEVSQELAVRGQAHGLVAQGAEAKIGLARAQYGAAESEANAQLEQIRAANVVYEAAAQNIEAQTLLRGQYLAQKTPQEIEALMGQKPGADGKVEIDGLKFTPTELRERQKQLQTREALSLLPPQVTDPEYAAKLNAYHSLTLQTMNLAELRALRAANGVLPDGQMVDAGTLDAFIERGQKIEADELLQQQNSFIAGQALGTVTARAGAMLKQLDSSIEATSPLRGPLNSLRAEAAVLAQASQNAELSDSQKSLALARYGKAEEKFYEEARKEATRQAGSDKDLQGILFAQLTGQEPDPVLFEEVLSGRLAANKPVGNMLRPEQSRRLATLYQQGMAAQASAGLTIESLQGEAPDKKEIRQNVARKAVQQLGAETAEQQATEFQVNSVAIKDHPLHGTLPAQMQQILSSASDAAWIKVKQKFGLSGEELSRIQRGQSVEGKSQDEIRDYFRQAAFEQEFYTYERMRPGLGTQVATWYAQNTGSFFDRQIQTLDPTLRTIASPYVADTTQALIDGWSAAKNRIALEAARNTAEYLTSAQDTYFNNALVLQMDTGLPEASKKLLMERIIQPVITRGKAAGLGEAEITQLVEKTLQEAKPQENDLKTALRLHLANRTALQQHFKTLSAELMLQHERKMTLGQRLSSRQLQATGYGDEVVIPELRSSELSWAYPDGKLPE